MSEHSPIGPPVPDDLDNEERHVTGWWKAALAAVGALVLVAMLGVPVMRIVLADDQPIVDLPDRAIENTALLFADALLERRSTSRAMDHAIPELHDHIDALVAELQLRDAADFENARVVLQRIPCQHNWPNESECYEATLQRPDTSPVLIVRFAVSEMDGLPRVVAVTKIGQIAKLDTRAA